MTGRAAAAEERSAPAADLPCRDTGPGAESSLGRPVIVVPVFNAAASLARCLDRLHLTLTADDHVLLADDNSTDPAIPGLCREFAARFAGTTTLLRHERNLGFVANVQRAMAECAPHHAILLNSDTLPLGDWVDAIQQCASADTRIATLTPWSNNAEICSFPDFCVANPMPGPDLQERLIRALRGLRRLPSVELPTAVGFAMWVRRQAWESLGGFDHATFGRGYGEENDFSLRAAAHGWSNRLCPGAYVAHEGHMSFAPLGEHPGGQNLQRLLARYPDYNARIARFIEADPLRDLREVLAAAMRVQTESPGSPP